MGVGEADNVEVVVDDGLAPKVKLAVGLVVGDPESVAVEEVLGDIAKVRGEDGVCVGLPDKVIV